MRTLLIKFGTSSIISSMRQLTWTRDLAQVDNKSHPLTIFHQLVRSDAVLCRLWHWLHLDTLVIRALTNIARDQRIGD